MAQRNAKNNNGNRNANNKRDRDTFTTPPSDLRAGKRVALMNQSFEYRHNNPDAMKKTYTTFEEGEQLVSYSFFLVSIRFVNFSRY